MLISVILAVRYLIPVQFDGNFELMQLCHYANIFCPSSKSLGIET